MTTKFSSSVEYDLYSNPDNNFFNRYFNLSHKCKDSLYEIVESKTQQTYLLLARDHQNPFKSNFILMWSSDKYKYYIISRDEIPMTT